MNQFLEHNWQGLVTLLGGIVVWLNKRRLAKWTLRKDEADYNTVTMQNLERGLKMYAAMLDDIEVRHQLALAKRDSDILELQIKVEQLTEQLQKHILKDEGSTD